VKELGGGTKKKGDTYSSGDSQNFLKLHKMKESRISLMRRTFIQFAFSYREVLMKIPELNALN
jgi:hypothetical protein